MTKNIITITFTSYGEVIPMELALALSAVIISAVVLLLQIVSLAFIAGMRKSLHNVSEGRPSPMPQGDRFDKRNDGFRRHERRPFQDQRPQAPSPAVDTVEKSLRDINMRLKSAERDQESARRKIQENFPRGDYPRNRDERDHRGNRGRDHNRNPRRDNWQERDRPGAPQQQQPAQTGTPQPRNAPFVEKKEPAVPPSEVKATVQQPYRETGQQEPTVADVGSGENLQHGRKIIVTRRVLNDEPAGVQGGTADAPPAPAPMPPPAENAEEETRIGGTDINPEGEIRFGRR